MSNTPYGQAKPNFGPAYEQEKQDMHDGLEDILDQFLKDGGMADEYQALARETAIFPGQGEPLGYAYCTLKLNGEAGEVAELIGKAIRDDHFGTHHDHLTGARRDQLAKELGDVLWYIAMIADQANISLSWLMYLNLKKTHQRKIEGKLQGSGSDR